MNRSDSNQEPASPANKVNGNGELRFRRLRRYRDTKLAGVFFLFLAVFFWWLPLIYTLNATIPPLELCNRSEGVLSFTGSTRRTGYRMILREDDGTTHMFACKVSAIANGTCGGREFAGQRAIVWWHQLDLHPLETVEHAVQIEVDGRTLLTHERSLRKLASAKERGPWFAIATTSGFLFILVIIFKIEMSLSPAVIGYAAGDTKAG